ncbi:helix-turn-helix domain-containing protein [Tessaracoccus massiliensis]|uniref:helix-turn-helix domain-containing protein n=1 Tax=Tessaracoccus massiliensis TaxID=1522311 RepID=UPI003CCC6F39
MRISLRHANLSVQEMADYLGVARTSVGNWLNDRVRISRQTMLLWAMRTGVPITWLETGQAPVDDRGLEERARRDSNPQPSDP